jgi:hypothetical protein
MKIEIKYFEKNHVFVSSIGNIDGGKCIQKLSTMCHSEKSKG